MTKETTQAGASGNRTEGPKKSPAFQPADEYAHRVDNDGEIVDDSGKKPTSERDEVMSAIEARVDAERLAAIEQEVEEYDTSMEEAQRAAQEATAIDGQDELEDENVEEARSRKRQDLPEEYQDDPLADYIVMDEENNTPMFVAKIDGKERYIPLDRARQQLQKHEAAETRLQHAAEYAKQLEAREAQIRAAEQALEAKQKAAEQSPPSVPQVPDVSDQDLRKEAQQFVNSMFAGTDDEAVESLAELLGRMRTGPQQSTPQIDPDEIANRAAFAAREQLRKEAEDRDVSEGFKKFSENYPDIMADPNLFRYADSLTDAIEAEWKSEGRSFMPSEVMREAGDRTRKWVSGLSGQEQTGEGDTPRGQDRQVRKRKLRPMPKTGSKKQSVREPQQPEETPHDYVLEMKRLRGQA